MPLVLLSSTLVLAPSASVYASPQAPSSVTPTSLDRVKERLDHPAARSLVPAVPVQLRPTFKSRVDQRVFVLTLEEDLHKTFDLNDLQRQSAAWSSQCCGLDLGALFKHIDKALDERRVRKTREEIARELAELAARAR
jgi:hypothetical protein